MKIKAWKDPFDSLTGENSCVLMIRVEDVEYFIPGIRPGEGSIGTRSGKEFEVVMSPGDLIRLKHELDD